MDKIIERLLEFKHNAVYVAFMECKNVISFSGISKEYFDKSSAWMLQKLHGYDVHGKKARFSANEYEQLIHAMRDIADRLNKYADYIEKAKADVEE